MKFHRRNFLATLGVLPLVGEPPAATSIKPPGHDIIWVEEHDDHAERSFGAYIDGWSHALVRLYHKPRAGWNPGHGLTNGWHWRVYEKTCADPPVSHKLSRRGWAPYLDEAAQDALAVWRECERNPEERRPGKDWLLKGWKDNGPGAEPVPDGHVCAGVFYAHRDFSGRIYTMVPICHRIYPIRGDATRYCTALTTRLNREWKALDENYLVFIDRRLPL